MRNLGFMCCEGCPGTWTQAPGAAKLGCNTLKADQLLSQGCSC